VKKEVTRMTGESMETAVPKVLAKHGWERTKGAGTPSEDRVYSHLSYPGHVIPAWIAGAGGGMRMATESGRP